MRFLIGVILFTLSSLAGSALLMVMLGMAIDSYTMWASP